MKDTNPTIINIHFLYVHVHGLSVASSIKVTDIILEAWHQNPVLHFPYEGKVQHMTLQGDLSILSI